MVDNRDIVQYESPELNVCEVYVEAVISLSNPTLENIGGEKEEMDW